MKPIQIIIDDIKNVFSSLSFDSFVSEFKCLSEEIDTKILIDVVKSNEKFLINLYYSELIPEDKNKISFLEKVEEIKNSFTNESMINSCGWVDVTSEKVETSRNSFIEKITLIGERR